MIETYGKWCFEEDSLIPCDQKRAPLDRPVYEVIRLIEGIPLFFHEHMMRLKNSLRLLNWDFQVSEDKLLNQMVLLFEKNGLSNDNIRLEIGKNNNGAYGVSLFCVKGVYPDKPMYENGVKVSLEDLLRENPQAKIYRENYAQKIIQIKNAKEVYEVVLHHQNKLSEGSRSNLFFIKGKKIFSAKSEDILLGISRIKLIEVLNRSYVAIEEKDLYIDEIATFEACFLTGTSIHLLPISEISGVCFDSSNHPLYNELSRAFQMTVQEDLLKTRRLLAHG